MNSSDFALSQSRRQIESLALNLFNLDRGSGRLSAHVKAVRLLDSVQNSGSNKPMLMIPVIPLAPVAMVSIGQIHIAMMPDSHLAVFDGGALVVCECNGCPAALPEDAVLVAGLVAQGRIVSVFQKDGQFYSSEAGRVVQLAQDSDCNPLHTDWPDMPTA